MNKVDFCYNCEFEAELIERVDGKWFCANCQPQLSALEISKEGFCYYCGFKEGDVRQGNFVQRKDGKKFHKACARRSLNYISFNQK